MSRRCQLTGREPGFGRTVSYSHRRSPRRCDPNVQDRRYRLPSENQHVRLRLSARAIKLVDRIGVEAARARLRARGEKACWRRRRRPPATSGARRSSPGTPGGAGS
ncbi:50S ribosomal protein L28 [Pseudonocardia sp. RS010]|uniref:50S ribosomal protein L28 n=1 Tax=Pseudonocardia sp. RS010 TaxID=3385979 RepID=UPI0039A14250